MSEAPSSTERIVRFGVFELDQRTGELRKAGLKLGLQDQPLHVLKMLLERPGELVTREELKQRLWPEHTFVDFEQGLNAAVKRLRSVLGDSADTPRFIETLPRRGYRLLVPVDAALGRGEPRTPATGAVTARFPRRSLVPPRSAWAAVILAALLAGSALYRQTRPDPMPEVVPLTSLTGAEWDPALSSDGRQVAFCWDGEGEPGLYVKIVGGNEHVRLAGGSAGVFNPAWSPDGREIAFLRHADPAQLDIHEIVVVSALGGAERRLGTTLSEGHGLDWSPDGGLLAFVNKIAAGAPDAIFVLAMASGQRRQLTTPPQTTQLAGDRQPAFSPDGRSVAFVRYHGRSIASDVFVQSVAAGDPRPLTSN
jgi:DNA-binding winged helix-turn-helix (wHTH) protein/Tol biopolymer transport system component